VVVIKYESILYGIGTSLSDALTTYANIEYLGLKENSLLRFKTIIDSSDNLAQNIIVGESIIYPIFCVGLPLAFKRVSKKLKDGIGNKEFGYKIMERVINKINSNKYLRNVGIDDAWLYLYGTMRLAATLNNLILMFLTVK